MELISKVNVYGLEESIKASKYPKSIDINQCTDEITKRTVSLGRADRGSGHDNFLKGIIVQFDLCFTIKAWTEAERYHFLEFVSSQSTMHCITQFDIEQQCCKYVDKRIIDVLKEKVDYYNGFEDKTTDGAKEAYLDVLYNVPVGFRLTARMSTNYQQLKTIYYQRRYHKLPEWREFCSWIETLPVFKDIVLK